MIAPTATGTVKKGDRKSRGYGCKPNGVSDITSMTATISASSTMYLVLNFVAEVRVALIVFILSPFAERYAALPAC